MKDDSTSGEVDVGYLQGTTVLRIRSTEDLAELWSLLKKPQKNTTLWCDGLSTGSHKRKHSDDDSDDDHQSRKEVRSMMLTWNKFKTLLNNSKQAWSIYVHTNAVSYLG